MESTMKLGMIIKQGTEKEVRKEYDELLQKAKDGYADLVYEFEDDELGTFQIKDENMKITFSLSKSLGDEYAIYQIFE
ncbi:hypothetical protein [Tissierella pigra]|uniref:Uncharacterized protein n=1 Tax=Tissierella pigra TaxID=2607614 RepID=A0A6N7XIA5_9FIRM|nr:hypothetical protein [Tissierella pigra]MSU01376.1 hypothetical protein [Tissierella pigra]